MTGSRIIVAAVGAALLLSASASAADLEAVARQRIVVGLADGARAADIARVAPLRVHRSTGSVAVFHVAADARRDAVLDRLRDRDDVRWAQREVVLQAQAPGASQWGLEAVRASRAWPRSRGRGVTVAVVDTGVATHHPDFAGGVWTNPRERVNGADDDGNGLTDDTAGWDFNERDALVQDQVGHGTMVASIVAARSLDAVGTDGVAPAASVMPLRVLDRSGGGLSSDIAAAFTYAARNGARVVNASLGGRYSHAIADAVAANPDTLFVVAAGNDGFDNDGDTDQQPPSYPCALPSPNLVCVGATDADGGPAEYSNHGRRTVDLAAPGTDVVASVPRQVVKYAEGFEGPLGPMFATGGDGAASWQRTSRWSTEGTHGLGAVDLPPQGAVTAHDGAGVVNVFEDDGCRLGYDLRIDDASEGGGVNVSLGPGMTALVTNNYSGPPARDVSVDIPIYNRFHDPFTPWWGMRFTAYAGEEGVLGDGVTIDALRATCVDAAAPTRDTDVASGTSFAAPHVAGVAALAFAAVPAASPAEVRDALVEGAVRDARLTGTSVSGGRLDAPGTLDALGAGPGETPGTDEASGTPPTVVAETDPPGDAEPAPQAQPGDDPTVSLDGVTAPTTTAPATRRRPLDLVARLQRERSGRRIRVRALRITAPAGSRVTVTCRAAGCPSDRLRTRGSSRQTVPALVGRRLGPGRIEIRARRGEMARVVTFTVSAMGAVRRRSACLDDRGRAASCG